MLAAHAVALHEQTETWAVKYRGPLTGRTLDVRLLAPRVEMIGNGRLWVSGTDAHTCAPCSLPLADCLHIDGAA